MIANFTIAVDPQRDEALYLQIAQQIRQAIAQGQLPSDTPLPTVRALAQTLHCTPGTVARAYATLQAEGLLVTRRGGGTHVADQPGAPSWLREAHLVTSLERSVLDSLAQGYSPAEIEAAFGLALARWRGAPQTLAPLVAPSPTAGLAFVGSHDLCLEALFRLADRPPHPVRVAPRFVGSLSGLMALANGQADVAGIHLLDETGQYNVPFVRRLFPGERLVLVNLATRLEGWIVAPGNPLGLRAWADAGRAGLRLVNRQRGAGARVLLDSHLRELGIAPTSVQGYDREVDTHLAVALAVARGEADTGLGIYAAARACGLDFVPLTEEPYDLVLRSERYEQPDVQRLLALLRGAEFRAIVDALGGYRVDTIGKETWL